jgi:hypothetical protein
MANTTAKDTAAPVNYIKISPTQMVAEGGASHKKWLAEQAKAPKKTVVKKPTAE